MSISTIPSGRLNPARWPALLDQEQAAEYLSISLATFKQLVADKTIEPVLISVERFRSTKLIRYRLIDLDDYIRGLKYGSDAKSVKARSVRSARQKKKGDRTGPADGNEPDAGSGAAGSE